MKIISALIGIILLFSCTSQRKIMDSWVGDTKQNLIFKWGPPERTSSDGGAGEVLVYSTQMYNAYANITTYNYRMFYVDSNGKIYHWRTESGRVPPQQMNVNLYIR